MRQLWDAIRAVETGGHADPANAVGDGGRSIGPYQISLAYWKDACKEHSALGKRPYGHVRDAGYAERVMLAYWQHYCPGALGTWTDTKCSRHLRARAARILAQTHNGGPKGSWNPATGEYWRRVRIELAKRDFRGCY